jgi:hypothetical protein
MSIVGRRSVVRRKEARAVVADGSDDDINPRGL